MSTKVEVLLTKNFHNMHAKRWVLKSPWKRVGVVFVLLSHIFKGSFLNKRLYSEYAISNTWIEHGSIQLENEQTTNGTWFWLSLGAGDGWGRNPKYWISDLNFVWGVGENIVFVTRYRISFAWSCSKAYSDYVIFLSLLRVGRISNSSVAGIKKRQNAKLTVQ